MVKRLVDAGMEIPSICETFFTPFADYTSQIQTAGHSRGFFDWCSAFGISRSLVM